MHGSSYLSSFPEEILLVMHLRKQMSVREWMAVAGGICKRQLELIFYRPVGLMMERTGQFSGMELGLERTYSLGSWPSVTR